MLIFDLFSSFFSKSEPFLENPRKWVLRGGNNISRNVSHFSFGALSKNRNALVKNCTSLHQNEKILGFWEKKPSKMDTYISNHNFCLKTERGFLALACFESKPPPIFKNNSPFVQNPSLKLVI